MTARVLDMTKPLALTLALAVAGFEVGGLVLFASADFGSCLDEASFRQARVVRYYLCSPQLVASGWRGWIVLTWLWSFPTLLAAFALTFRSRTKSE